MQYITLLSVQPIYMSVLYFIVLFIFIYLFYFILFYFIFQNFCGFLPVNIHKFLFGIFTFKLNLMRII